MLSPPRTPPRKASKEEEREFQKAFQHNTNKKAEKIYRQRNTKYNKSILQKEKKREELIKEIEHFQYSISDQLIEFDRAHSTLLATDWQKIRDLFTVIDITHPDFHFHIEKSIDALEAIKAKIEYQQQVEPTTETEEKTTLSIRKRIWNLSKRIPRWICGIIVAVVVAVIAAIVVNIFSDFGWIGRIKDFIYNVVGTK